MVGHGSQSKASVWIVVVALVSATVAAAFYWTRDGATAGGASDLVNVDFDAGNGELGQVQTEVRIDDRPPQTVTASCSAPQPGKPNVCRMKLALSSGRRVLLVRTLTPRGWTGWSEPTTLVIE